MGASRPYARSPRTAAPRIRFLFVGPRFRSALPPHGRSPFRSCAPLDSLRPACRGTSTLKVSPVPGVHKESPPVRRALWESGGAGSVALEPDLLGQEPAAERGEPAHAGAQLHAFHDLGAHAAQAFLGLVEVHVDIA